MDWGNRQTHCEHRTNCQGFYSASGDGNVAYVTMSATSLDEPGSAGSRHPDGLPLNESSSDVIRVVVSGGQWPLGRRVIEILKADGGFEVREVNQSTDVIDASLDVFIHLASGDHDALVERRRSAVIGTPELLQAATVQGAKHIVLLSSAMVYGAWPNNPIPLTEDTALRPDFGFAFARQLATVEQLVDDWRVSGDDRSTTVLRPVLAMAADGASSLVRALAAGMGRFGDSQKTKWCLQRCARWFCTQCSSALIVGYGTAIAVTRSDERNCERLTLAFSTWPNSSGSSPICAFNLACF